MCLIVNINYRIGVSCHKKIISRMYNHDVNLYIFFFAIIKKLLMFLCAIMYYVIHILDYYHCIFCLNLLLEKVVEINKWMNEWMYEYFIFRTSWHRLRITSIPCVTTFEKTICIWNMWVTTHHTVLNGALNIKLQIKCFVTLCLSILYA